MTQCWDLHGDDRTRVPHLHVEGADDNRREPAMSTETTGQATAYHDTIKDLRRDLIESHLEYERAMAPHRTVVFDAMNAVRGTDAKPQVSAAEMGAYTGLMMSAAYSYALAAVLERAEKMDPDVAQKLAALADCILENGGETEICADVWPAQPCDGCGKPVIPCAAVASHIGCSSARGYIHQGSGAHSCEPRSGAPYAHPVSLRSDIGEATA